MGASGNPPCTAAFVGAPFQWGFARHGHGLRRVRGGSCAPNAMPPFRASLEASHCPPHHSAEFRSACAALNGRRTCGICAR